MTNIGARTVVHDSILLIRGLLTSGVTDPVSGTRGANQRFIMTGWPSRRVTYPYVTIEHVGQFDAFGGFQTDVRETTLNFQIDVWVKPASGIMANQVRDQISDDIYRIMRENQRDINAGLSGTVVQGLFNFRLLSAFNNNEEGRMGVKRKTMEVQYVAITGSQV